MAAFLDRRPQHLRIAADSRVERRARVDERYPRAQESVCAAEGGDSQCGGRRLRQLPPHRPRYPGTELPGERHGAAAAGAPGDTADGSGQRRRIACNWQHVRLARQGGFRRLRTDKGGPTDSGRIHRARDGASGRTCVLLDDRRGHRRAMDPCAMAGETR
jgi:hypothetical protein